MLAYARIICGPVSVRYRSSETNYQYEYRHKGIYYLVAFKKLFFYPSLTSLMISVNVKYHVYLLTYVVYVCFCFLFLT